VRLCIPILAKTTAEALRKSRRPYPCAGGSEPILELRMDWIRDPELRMLLAGNRHRLMVTNRRREEGGLFAGSEEERVKVLREGAVLGADYVDIEMSTGDRLIAGLKEAIGSHAGDRTKLVLSWHEFRNTPSQRCLREKLARCMEWGPDIVKIVTMARRVEDNLEVLRLIPYARQKGVEIIAFCMGPAGRISRVVSPLMGGYLTFASAADDEASAPGQVTFADMVNILHVLGSEGV